MVIPECPYPLLGRDLLHKLWAQVIIQEKRTSVKLPKEEEFEIQTHGIFVTLSLGEYLLTLQKGT